MADLIDREELKKRYITTAPSGGYSGDVMSIVINHLTRLLRLIDEAPTVEQKKGEWSKNEWGNVVEESCCPFCGRGISDYVLASETWMLVDFPNYCPNCGADLRGENDALRTE